MKVLDLFSGIGGFSLGLERASFETVAFCEVDKKAQLVLKKHWPNLPIFDDVRELTHDSLRRLGIERPEVICGGFPCQDISIAGNKAGISGARSGLWSEYKRIIGEIRPDYAIIENVANLRGKGLVTVLQDLREIGYDAEWHLIPARAVGAPHQRDRIWIISYPNITRSGPYQRVDDKKRSSRTSRGESLQPDNREAYANNVEQIREDVANTVQSGLQRPEGEGSTKEEREPIGLTTECLAEYGYSWSVEPSVGRVVNGLPGRVDRIKQLGNSIVPQIAEAIGNSIVNYELYKDS